MRAKSKGRREAEKFAYIPESLLLSKAGQSLPHAALKVLTILVMGRTKERNGTMCCSESFAAKFGINSRATVHRSLTELIERGIIVVTRKVAPFKKWPTLYGVTWWPIAYRDGGPSGRAETPTFAYLKWQEITPTVGVENGGPASSVVYSLTPMVDIITPVAGVESANHHTHGETEHPNHHTYGEGQSLDIRRGAPVPTSVPAFIPSSSKSQTAISQKKAAAQIRSELTS